MIGPLEVACPSHRVAVGEPCPGQRMGACDARRYRYAARCWLCGDGHVEALHKQRWAALLAGAR